LVAINKDYKGAFNNTNSTEFLEFAEEVEASVSVTFAVKNFAGSL
jgi:hypothetical protein